MQPVSTTGKGQGFPEDALLADNLLGGGLPAEAEHHLTQAGLSYHQGEVAEAHLSQALLLAPDHAAVLIGLYRFYFYKGRLRDALEIAGACLDKALRDNELPDDWRQVRPGDAAFDRYEEILPRFFLFALKGYAYLNMRLSDIDEGKAAVLKLLELDPGDKIGARVLLEVAERMGCDDDD